MGTLLYHKVLVNDENEKRRLSKFVPEKDYT